MRFKIGNYVKLNKKAFLMPSDIKGKPWDDYSANKENVGKIIRQCNEPVFDWEIEWINNERFKYSYVPDDCLIKATKKDMHFVIENEI